MKVRNYLESIAGVGIYPVITLLIFFIFFSLLSLWVVRSRRNGFDAQSMLPFEAEPLQPITTDIL